MEEDFPDIPPIRFYGRKVFHTLPEAADEIEMKERLMSYLCRQNQIFLHMKKNRMMTTLWKEERLMSYLCRQNQIFLHMKKNRMMTTLWKVKFQMMCRVLRRSVLEIRSNGVTVIMNPFQVSPTSALVLKKKILSGKKKRADLCVLA
ncbi:hypothetical protein QE152_g35242 [Popillia japonica]|uniref:Uncharacterized protein n=1 Tax=Popillia japonica TaxID=7064 RepID=A0AAW1IGG4_POPJA